MRFGRWERPAARDVAWAVLFTLAAQIELSLTSSPIQGSLAIQRLAFLVITGAVALRRVAPLWAAAITAIGFAVQGFQGSAPIASGFLALLFILVSLGLNASVRTGAIGVAFVLVGGGLPSIVNGDGISDLVVNVVVILGSWGGALAWRRSVDQRIAAELARDLAARRAVEADRSRIARDLHDSVAHAITVMTLQAGGARRRSSDPDVVDALHSVESSGRQALADMHRFLGLLGSDAEGLDEAPGLRDVPDVVDTSRGTGANVGLTITGDVAHVPASVGATGYRVVQEALTNALKHAHDPTADVIVQAADTELQLRISSPWSNGAPHPTSSQDFDGGRGLAGLRERVELFDGSFRAGPEQDMWVVEATIPFTATTR